MASISGSSSAARSDAPVFARVCAATAALAALIAVCTIVSAAKPRFYFDDPLWTDDDAALDAARVVSVEDAGSFDFIVNTFTQPGDRRRVRAMNVNTLDEVPDSSWFVNRIGRAPMTAEAIARGPDRQAAITLDGWVVSSGKSTGLQPGFRMTDPSGQLYQIEFDPIGNPEMATGAEIIGTAFYHAFGYHTVEVYLAELDPQRIVIAEKATIWDPLLGERRRLTRRDIQQVLRRGARQANGKYRVLASRFADGAPLGNFRYYGTRPDDPNDIVPHEHRRELRAARVFGAWLNHDDSRGVNSLDMLVRRDGRSHVKHYMFDFGSIMGSGTVNAQRHRAGNEYILEWKPGWLTLATLGVYTRPWMHIDYPDVPASVGRFEADAFEPERWKPEYPNAAFANMRADDAFWAARIVARFDAAAIRAVVEKARFSDPRATEYVTRTLIARRDKVLRTWLTQVNPLVDFALTRDGVLTFTNAAAQAGIAPPATAGSTAIAGSTAASGSTAPAGSAAAGIGYRVRWSRFDNATDTAQPVGDASIVREPRATAPAALLGERGAPGPEFVQVEIDVTDSAFPAWKTPVTVHFRRAPDGWTLVGVQRAAD